MPSIIRYRHFFYLLSLGMMLGSVFSLATRGLNLGVDFSGGSLLEVRGEVVRSKLPQDTHITLQKTATGAVLRFKETDEATHQKILQAIGNEELRFEALGPVIGQELKRKTLWAIGLVLSLIILYVAWAFRKVKNSFRYGFLAIAALIHDVLITTGVFSFLRVELDAAFIVAFLTILGYSVNDTIVVFDRIRENLLRTENRAKALAQVIDDSIAQTMRRSLFTSLTTLLALIAVFFFGGYTIRNFVLALIIGITVGTYSSIFLASPGLISWPGKKLKT